MDSRRVLRSAVALLFVQQAAAGLTVYHQDFEGWQTAAGAYSTCDFTGFSEGTFITDQYAYLARIIHQPTVAQVELARRACRAPSRRRSRAQAASQAHLPPPP